jgi:N-acetylglucosaminyldiphosphoundecaprenol N-acetyl-beta-D-mannosaminyltransferase
MKSKKIMDVRVDFDLEMSDVIEIIEDKMLKDEKNHLISTTNPEFIIDASSDNEFKEIINKSSLSTPDGIGVIYAKEYLEKVENYKRNILFPFRALILGIWLGFYSFLFGNKRYQKRITGVDLTYKICELSSKKKYTIFFLGGRPKNVLGKFINEDDSDMSNKAADAMRRKYPGVNIVGATSQFSKDRNDDKKTVEFIKKTMNEKGIKRIDFLFVAYNHIGQEKWIMRNKDKIPAKVSIGCGGTFDFIVGNCTLPPNMFVKRGLGWLYRLFKQPWRLKRILKAFPLFPMKIYLYSLLNMHNNVK